MSSRSCSSPSARTFGRLARALALCPLLLVADMSAAEGAEPAVEVESETPAPERPTWRFRRDDKPVKVVVLAGSIGAFPRQPYASHIERMCSEVEVRNLSKTGLGAWALRKRFDEQVVDNPAVRPKSAEDQEHWLVFGGGLNSIGAPLSTNHHIRRLFLLAHRTGFRVVGLTPTPWGDDADRRFRGLGGLEYREATRTVADFILGRLGPREALGNHAGSRGDAEAPWEPEERPDVAIDLYDSTLRDREAGIRDLEAMRRAVREDKRWQREHAHLGEHLRVLKAETTAIRAAELPRWYLRPELRSFDHIHPNAEGHRLIAEIMCPQLPTSWGCTCPNSSAPEGDATSPPATK
jgi:hypothetical protein